MGIVSAVKRDSFWDYGGMLLVTVSQVTPVYWLGLMLILFFAVRLRLLPSSGRGSVDHLILPAITLGAPLMALVMIPLVTVVGRQFGALLGGAVITATVFAWPGVGWVAVEAITARDYPLVHAATLLVASYFVVINPILDVLYVYLDPRIRYA